MVQRNYLRDEPEDDEEEADNGGKELPEEDEPEPEPDEEPLQVKADNQYLVQATT